MEVKRLFDIFPYQKENYPQEKSVTGKYDGKWVHFSTDQVIAWSDRVALGLLKAGYRPGDMIGVMAGNRPEWVIADQAIQKMGGIVVPIYPTMAAKDLVYIFNHCGLKALFLEDKDLYDKVASIQAQCSDLKALYTFLPVKGAELMSSLEEEVPEGGPKQLAEIQNRIKGDDLATIIYTSGTTGNPKGVMLSHNNIVSNVNASIEVLPVGQEHSALSFLPLSHIFERMMLYMYAYVGISIYFAESLETIGDNLKEIRPHAFSAVPRLLEKVFDKIQAGGAANTGIKRKLFEWTTKLALQWEPDRKNGGWYHFKLGIADKLVASKIRQKAGIDRTISCASGSAALNPRLARFFNGIGLTVVEGYGLTETSPVISVNGFTPGTLKVGHVGHVIAGGEVKIAEDGEILYKGPNLMMGYYKAPDKTAEVIDENGWFHTGDIGIVDSDGFLKITDRKKAIFKTSGGKYIAPQLMENKFKESPFIEQIAVIGEYRKFPGALIVPNFEHLQAWCKDQGIGNGDVAKLCQEPQVLKIYQDEITRLNADFAKWEKVKRFEIIPNEWTTDTGEVTPTLKLKRKVILKKYEAAVERIYDV